MRDTQKWKDVENDLRKYINKTLSSAAGKIRDDLTKEAKMAIDDFYKNYPNPKSYHRHFYNFQNNSFRKYYSNPHNEIFRGGVELTPQQMDDIYEDSTTEVFDLVWNGFHGVASTFYTPHTINNIPPVMIPSPIRRLLDKRDDIIANIDKYIDYGKKIASNESYLTISMR